MYSSTQASLDSLASKLLGKVVQTNYANWNNTQHKKPEQLWQDKTKLALMALLRHLAMKWIGPILKQPWDTRGDIDTATAYQ